MYGFFSEQASERDGTVIYQGPGGVHIEVTAVYPDEVAADYKWPDKKCVGPVGEFVKMGRRGRRGLDVYEGN
jgi:hypothetical protein